MGDRLKLVAVAVAAVFIYLATVSLAPDTDVAGGAVGALHDAAKAAADTTDITPNRARSQAHAAVDASSDTNDHRLSGDDAKPLTTKPLDDTGSDARDGTGSAVGGGDDASVGSRRGAGSGGGSGSDGSDGQDDGPSTVAEGKKQNGHGATTPKEKGSLPRNGIWTDGVAGCYKKKLHAWRPAKCAEDNWWLMPWMSQRPHAEWTMVDVGANKGYVVTEWLQTLVEGTNFTSKNLGIGIFSRKDVKKSVGMCGGCCECLESPPRVPPKNYASHVTLHAFEPSSANHEWIAAFFKNTTSTTMYLHHAAVGATATTAKFPKIPFGKETGSVKTAGGGGGDEMESVQIVTLDEHLRGIRFIDVLSTDTEGHDVPVAYGAKAFLSEGRVGVYQFEMNGSDDYKKFFEQLEGWGYVCFFATSSKKQNRVPILIRVTNCWVPEYAGFHGWMNGLCYNDRIVTLRKIFAGLARKRHRGGTGMCEGKLQQRSRVLRFLKTNNLE